LSKVEAGPLQTRRFGLDQGKIVIRDDFDEPLLDLEKELYGSPDSPDDPA